MIDNNETIELAASAALKILNKVFSKQSLSEEEQVELKNKVCELIKYSNLY